MLREFYPNEAVTKGKQKKSYPGLLCIQLGARQRDADTPHVSLFHGVGSVFGPGSRGGEPAQETHSQYQAGWVVPSQQQTPGSACLP